MPRRQRHSTLTGSNRELHDAPETLRELDPPGAPRWTFADVGVKLRLEEVDVTVWAWYGDGCLLLDACLRQDMLCELAGAVAERAAFVDRHDATVFAHTLRWNFIEAGKNLPVRVAH